MKVAETKIRLRTPIKVSIQKGGEVRPLPDQRAYLVADPKYFEKWGLSLHIEGTSGRWFLISLFGGKNPKNPDQIWIDGGQGYSWDNPQEVWKEARKHVRLSWVLR